MGSGVRQMSSERERQRIHPVLTSLHLADLLAGLLAQHLKHDDHALSRRHTADAHLQRRTIDHVQVLGVVRQRVDAAAVVGSGRRAGDEDPSRRVDVLNRGCRPRV